MGGTNRDGMRPGGDYAADQSGAWDIDRDALWTWIAEALDGVEATELDAAALTALCARALDTHAPAALVHAQAAGVALEYLVVARLTDAYVGGAERVGGQYELARLRAAVQQVQGGLKPAA